MYGGHGQVLMSFSTSASMGVAECVTSSSDHHQHALFSSQVQNPDLSFNFLPNSFHNFPSLLPKEESGMLGLMSSGSEHEVGPTGAMSSGNELDVITAQLPPGAAASKKKRYHRHTARQIQEMEALFKECPHPDDKQRLRLSQELGLTPRQIKFWFQNRRTQMKAQQDRTDNVILRAENDGLKTDNYRLKALIRSLICPTCGGASLLGEVEYDEHHLRLENARLKEELDRLCSLAGRYSCGSLQPMGPPHQRLPPPPPGLLHPSLDLDMSIYSRHFHEPSSAITIPIPPIGISSHHHDLAGPPHHHDGRKFQGHVFVLDEERSLAMDLALSALDELAKMCHMDKPLWIGNVLNVEEYTRMFPLAMNTKQCVRIEATRHTDLVIMNSLNLVDSFLDVNKWIELFPSIISRAKTIQIVTSTTSGQASGSLHLMYAEFQVVTPLVPTRESYFLRYCHYNSEARIWSVVDFPLHGLQCFDDLQTPMPRYTRRPSGCIIQDMPNGYSRVTWIEHAELVEEKPVHQIFNRHVTSGKAFGAQRWLAVLQRQCERVASQMAKNITDLGVIQSPEARKNLMKSAQRMIRMFCTNMSTIDSQSWTALSDLAEDTIRISTRKVTEQGQPNGVILSAVSTTWLPYAHDLVFNLLKNEHKRSEIEALSNGYTLHEVAHIANGSDPGNCISLLRLNVASNSSQNVELMLQESCRDSSGSLIVYTTMDVNYIQLVMTGQDPSSIPLLPMGFSIIPATSDPGPQPRPEDNGSGPGCLLTVGLQVHASTNPNAKLSLSSVNAINSHLCNAVSQINAALNTDGHKALKQ
ncbi:hypothetical protein V2J09_020340 [Rumex salicifolius]